MKKHINYLSALLISVTGAFCSCSSDDNGIDGGLGSGDNPVLKVALVPVSDATTVARYPHNLYLVQNDKLLQTSSSENAANLEPVSIKPGDYSAYGLVASSFGNLNVPQDSESGMANYQIKLKDQKKDIPEILVGGIADIKAANSNLLKSMKLQRTVGSVVVTVGGLQSESETIKLIIDNMCDQVKLSDGLPGKSGAEYFSKEITLVKNEKDHYLGAAVILPTNVNASSLSLRFVVGDKTVVSTIAETNITKFEANREYTLNARFTGMEAKTNIASKVWEKSPVVSDNIAPDLILISMSPVTGAKLTDVTIKGANFGTDKNAIQVFFGDVPVVVNEVTENAIEVTISEPLEADVLSVKVVKTKSEEEKEEKILLGQQFTYVKEWWVSTLVGLSGQNGLTDGTFAQAKFSRPSRLRWDDNNNLIVCDDNSGTPGGAIRVVNMNTKMVSTIVPNIYEPGAIGFSSDFSKVWISVGNVSIRPKLGHIITRNANKTWDGAASVIMNDDKGLFKKTSNDHIFGLATVGNYVYFLTKFGNQLIRMDQTTGDYEEIASTLELPNWCAMAYCPYDKKMYVVGKNLAPDDALKRCYVYRFDPAKQNLTAADVEKFVGAGTAGRVEGQGANVKIGGECYGIDADAQGNVYIVDASNACVWKIDKDKNAKIIAGGTSGYQNGKGSSSKFNYPFSVTAAPDGKVYVGDFYNRVIRCVSFE